MAPAAQTNRTEVWIRFDPTLDPENWNVAKTRKLVLEPAVVEPDGPIYRAGVHSLCVDAVSTLLGISIPATGSSRPIKLTVGWRRPQ